MRTSMRRFTRFTNGCGKTLANHTAAVALHDMHDNFARRWLVAVLMVNASTLAVVGTVTILALSGRWRWVPALSLFVGG